MVHRVSRNPSSCAGPLDEVERCAATSSHSSKSLRVIITTESICASLHLGWSCCSCVVVVHSDDILPKSPSIPSFFVAARVCLRLCCVLLLVPDSFGRQVRSFFSSHFIPHVYIPSFWTRSLSPPRPDIPRVARHFSCGPVVVQVDLSLFTAREKRSPFRRVHLLQQAVNIVKFL